MMYETGPQLSTTELVVDARAELPSRFGTFQAVTFRPARIPAERQLSSEPCPIAMVHGDVRGQDGVLARMHSECLTGDVLGSLRCDCRAQLEAALERIAKEPCGVLLYLRQEGRGIGLGNKLRAYQLQDGGLDTVDANLALGFADDLRHYDEAAAMLRALEISSVRLLTNNPDKVDSLERAGIRVVERLTAVTPPTEENASYLDTKKRRCGHIL